MFCVYCLLIVCLICLCSICSFSTLILLVGLLTCKNRLPYNIYCVGRDVKHCSIQGARCWRGPKRGQERRGVYQLDAVAVLRGGQSNMVNVGDDCAEQGTKRQDRQLPPVLIRVKGCL